MALTKEEIAKLFMEGIDCSQVVAGEFAQDMGMTKETAYKLTAAFGGGLGEGETCGAVVGAMMVLGMKYGHFTPDDQEQKDIMNAKRSEFIARFKEKYCGCSCKALLQYDISKPEDLEKILEKGLLFDFCPEIVKDAIEILKDM